MVPNKMRPIHPGEILQAEYLIPLELSANTLAQLLRVPATRLHAISNQRRSITANIALRLARYFGGDAQSWVNLQIEHDLKVAELERGAQIRKEVAPRAV